MKETKSIKEEHKSTRSPTNQTMSTMLIIVSERDGEKSVCSERTPFNAQTLK